MKRILKFTIFFVLIFPLTTYPSPLIDIELKKYDSDLALKVSLKNFEPVIVDKDDFIYLWNRDEKNRPYYMIGQGPLKREDLYIGSGYSNIIHSEYLIIGILNKNARMGQFFAKNLVENMIYNQKYNTGIINYDPFGIYPTRIIIKNLPLGIERIECFTSYYEYGTNHYYLRLKLKRNFFKLAQIEARDIALIDKNSLMIKIVYSDGP